MPNPSESLQAPSAPLSPPAPLLPAAPLPPGGEIWRGEIRHLALHVGFLDDSTLAVWAERAEPRLKPPASATATAIPSWPHAATAAELAAALTSWGAGKLAARGTIEPVIAWLPLADGAALPSQIEWRAALATGAAPTLTPSTIAAMRLPWRAAIELLALFAQDAELVTAEPGALRDDDLSASAITKARARPAADTLFFSHALRMAARQVLDGRFAPSVERAGDALRARWQPVLRDEERAWVTELAAAMPGAARALTSNLSDTTAAEPTPPNRDPRLLTRRFFDTAVDMLVRLGANEARQLGLGLASRVRSQHDAWLRALVGFDPAVALKNDGERELDAEVAEWQRPLQLATEAPFRLVFRLEEPVDEDGTNDGTWALRLLLRGADDPSLLVPLDEALDDTLEGRKTANALHLRGLHLRELALVGLGQAAGVSPLVAASLGGEIVSELALTLDQAHLFLTRDALALEQAGFVVLLPAWWSRRKGKQPLVARGRLRNTFGTGTSTLSLDEVVTVDWDVALGDQTLSPAELQALAKVKAPLVKLRGQWVELDANQLREAIERWKKQGTTTAKVRDLMRLSLGVESDDAPLPVDAIIGSGLLGELFDGLSSKERYRELPSPIGFVGTLRPYQLRGYSWLKFLRRFGLPACLADDMGLGKTIQTLALLADEQAAGEKRPALLVCPTSIVGNWQREAARFTPGLRVMVHHGIERSRDREFLDAARQHSLVVTTYSLLSRDSETFTSLAWAGVILDEAQNIKNPDTKQARAARSLQADWRVALTGTPVENHVGDLWSLFEFLGSGLLPPRDQFQREFLMPIRVGRDDAALKRLKRRTGPFILRRLKSDPAILPELPSKLEYKVICNLTREQASLYAAVVNEMTERLRSAVGIERRGVILAALTKLKQVCNHPVHLLQDGSPLPGRSGKLARATEMLEEVVDVDDRALVFTQFREMGELLQRHFGATLGREVIFLHGGTPRALRQELVDRFQDDPHGPSIFILSLKAGGTGLNLTRASHVFHYDRWWNPAVEQQATDRAHRIGQTRQLQVHVLVCAGTLEERIDALLERKKAVAELVVGSGEKWLTELSTEQLRELVALDAESVAE